MGRFLVGSIATLLVIGAASLFLLQKLDTLQAIRNARTESALIARNVVEPVVSDALVNGDPGAVRRVDAVVRKQVLAGSTLRVKLWTRDGRIVYSDEPRLIGSKFTLAADDLATFQTGVAVAEVSDLSRPENRYERSYGKLLEVYLPISTPSGGPLLYEAYLRYDTVADHGHELFHVVAPTLFGGLLFAGLLQLPLAWSMARRLESGHRSRKDLLTQASHLAAIVESSDDAIIGTDVGGRITSWNPAAQRIYGYGIDEVLGASIDLFEPPDKAAEAAELARMTLAGDPVRNFQTERVRKDGSRISVALTKSVVFDAEGQVGGVSTIVRDVTDLVQVQTERDTLLRERTSIAELLQQALLPDRLPQTKGISMAARFIPCADGARVGGDWYDVIPLGPQRLGLVMGDVQGHDIRAASLMGQARNALRAWATDGLAPAEVLHRLNRLVNTFADGALITCIYATLDVATGEIAWSGAGHLPPIVIDGAGEAQTLVGEPHPPLGGMPDVAYTEKRESLAPGTTLLLYTDGLVERRDESLETGLLRLTAVSRAFATEASADDRAEALCESVIATMTPAGNQLDDVALLVVVIEPSDECDRTPRPAMDRTRIPIGP